MKFSLPAKTAAPAPTESPMDLQALTGSVHFHCGIICKIWAHSSNFQLIQIISQPTLQEQLSPAAPGNHMTSFALYQPQDFLFSTEFCSSLHALDTGDSIFARRLKSAGI